LAAAGYVTGGWTEKRCTSVGSHHHVVQQQRSQSHTQVKKVDSSSLSVQHIYLVGDRRRRYIHVQSIKSVVTGGQQSKTCWPDIFKYINKRQYRHFFVCLCVSTDAILGDRGVTFNCPSLLLMLGESL
jgi:hypothetical protein